MADPFTGDQFAVMFSQFAGMPDLNTVVSQVFNTFVIHDVDAAKFGVDYVAACMMLTAHWLVLFDRAGAGALTSERVGELSRSYQQMPDSETLGQTTYGLMFRRVARRHVGPFYVAGGCFPTNLGKFPGWP